MLERIWKRILRRQHFSLLSLPASLLWVASLLYRVGLILHRKFLPAPIKVGMPVLSVGNMTVGGSGKTPLVGCIARLLSARSFRVGIVSSGYGRSDVRPLLESGERLQQMDVSSSGDEMKSLAEQLPEAIFSIDRSKTFAARRLADSRRVDVIIVDDGYQHRRLFRNLDLVAFDASVSERHLRLFPYGVLREPLSAIGCADQIVITRAEGADDIDNLQTKLRALNTTAELYRARFVIDELVSPSGRKPISWLKQKSVFLFAGIGNFTPFLRQLESLARRVDDTLELSDHQRYDRKLLERIKRLADRHNSEVIITTGKDWVKLLGFDFGRELYYVPLTVKLDPDENLLTSQLIEKLGLTSRSF